MRGEGQMEQMLLSVGGEFGKRKLVEWQQQRAPRRNFDAQRFCLWVSGVTFGWFCAHVFGVFGDDGIVSSGKIYRRPAGQNEEESHAAGPKAGCHIAGESQPPIPTPMACDPTEQGFPAVESCPA